MLVTFDPETALLVAADRIARLRRDRIEPLHTLAPWRTGSTTPSGLDGDTPKARPACPTSRMPASAS